MTHAEPKPIVPLLDYQKRAVESSARFRWSCWSRQSGKSFTMSLRRIIRGLQRGRNQIFLSASERQSRELMEKARQHCQVLKIVAEALGHREFAKTTFKQLEIQLPNRVRIIGLAANPQTVRGYTGDVFLDEFAMHADDRAIWASIFPSLLRGRGELDIASTPKGRKNLFYDLRNHDRFECNTLTLPQAVNQGLNVDAEEIRSSMADDELYRQEFLCEFLDEATAFLTYDAIAACEDASLEKETPITELADVNGDLFVGIDIGRKRDLTVLWIIQRSGDTCITRAVYERQGLPFRDQYALLTQVLSLPSLRRACIDAGGLGMQLAESAVEDFGPHRVEAVTFTNTLKSQLAGNLRIAVENQSIRIPVDEAVRNDWHSLERSVTAAGLMRFEAAHSRTGHADRFWAAALALRAAGNDAGPREFLTVKPLAFAGRGAW